MDKGERIKAEGSKERIRRLGGWEAMKLKRFKA